MVNPRKECSHCKKKFPRTTEYFYKNKSGKDGFDIYCKNCRKAYQQSDRCKQYQKEYQQSEKYRDYQQTDNRKQYQKEYKKKYHQSEKYKKYYQTDKNKHYRKEYKQSDRCKQSSKEYRQTDKGKISSLLRSRLYKALKGNYKTGSAVRDLGCTIPELKIHLGNQFQEGMTWDLLGKEIHIDHIKPLCKFDLTDREQFLQACHYTNLQPLWAHDNLTKNSKYQEVV